MATSVEYKNTDCEFGLCINKDEPFDRHLHEDIDVIREQLQKIKLRSFSLIEPMEARLERYLSKLKVPVEHLRKMVDSFVDELQVGLVAHLENPYGWDSKRCSFKMIDSCILNLPTGNEKGAYYALDFGGTNFRVVRANLLGNGKIESNMHSESLLTPKECSKHNKGLLDPKATATEMFDFFAQNVLEFLTEQGDISQSKDKTFYSGFTFSFPCNARSIKQAILMNWTKGFETGRQTDDPVENLDVVELMNVAFLRNKVPARCNSVLNDTVGTLLSCAYTMDHSKHPPCIIGLILGTGMNCCYYEESALMYGYQGKVINVECGNFNRNLPRMNIDCELDFKSVDNRGFQQIEKMCSGAYLGEICRLALVRILAERLPPFAWQSFSLISEQISRIMNDKSANLQLTRRIILDIWHMELPLDLLQVIHRVATAVMDRAATLVSVLIAGCAKKSGRLQPAFGGLSVGVDGSLYKRNPHFQAVVRESLDAVLGPELSKLIHIIPADDGSGKGAAILAATLCN